MLLLLDIGNTRIKWALLRDGRLTECEQLTHRDEQWPVRLANKWASMASVQRIVASCVADQAVRTVVSETAERCCGVRPEWVEAAAEGCGVRNAYAVPQRLGPDRWAALVGARTLTAGAVCVVDCGTAVTLDVLGAGGDHLGGWILPGLGLMRQSLSGQTGRLGPVAEEDGEVRSPLLPLGHDTAECIRVGTRAAVVATIERGVVEAMAAAGPALACILTGGDAPHLRDALALSKEPILRSGLQVEPHLVLQGLASLSGVGLAREVGNRA